jgi:hypothetical protein
MNAQAPKVEDAENDPSLRRPQQSQKPPRARRVLFAALGKCELTSASPLLPAGEKRSSEVAFLTQH